MAGKSTYSPLKRLLCLSAALVICLAATALLSGASSNGGVWNNYPTLGASSGDMFTFKPGDASLSMGSEGDPAKFVSLTIGGYVLSRNVYSIGGDGCTVTVSGIYLASFDEGEYPVRFAFSDGETNATLRVGETTDAGMLEGGSEVSAPPAAASEPPAPTPPAETAESGSATVPSAAASADAEGPYTGFSTVMLGLVALSGGSAAVFGLGKRWMGL